MTFVGKILVLVNLVLSIMFMAFAVTVYTAREDVQGKISKLNEQTSAAQKAKQEAETATADLEEKLKSEKQQHEETKATLQDDVARLTQQAETLDAQLKQARNEVAQTTAALQSATIEQTQRKQEVEERTQERDALLKEKSDLVSERTALQDELSQTKNDLEILTARANEMQTKLQQYVSWIVRNNDGVEPTASQLEDQGELSPPPDVDGRVTQVDDTGRFVQLSIGGDDGIREGHELQVWRTSPEPKYIGKIKIYTVSATTAVAQPISVSSGRGLIRKGDHVGPRIRGSR